MTGRFLSWLLSSKGTAVHLSPSTPKHPTENIILATTGERLGWGHNQNKSSLLSRTKLHWAIKAYLIRKTGLFCFCLSPPSRSFVHKVATSDLLSKNYQSRAYPARWVFVRRGDSLKLCLTTAKNKQTYNSTVDPTASTPNQSIKRTSILKLAVLNKVRGELKRSAFQRGPTANYPAMKAINSPRIHYDGAFSHCA